LSIDRLETAAISYHVNKEIGNDE